MSSQVASHPSSSNGEENDTAQQQKPGKRNRRSRGRRNNRSKHEKDNITSCYQNVTFQERPSSGRPGSPHRYFDNSYNVSFNNNSGSDVDVEGSLKETETSGSPLETSQPIMENHSVCENNQVVHRHLNGLCIVTAGNVLTKLFQESKQNNDGEPTIASIQYLVKVGKDSQSAKGKIRTKNKRQKRGTRNHENVEEGDESKAAVLKTDHDGNVSPHDPLCRITLSNGQVIQLNCCVAGTIIEINQQLLDSSVGTEECKEGVIMNGGTDAIVVDTVKEGSDGQESFGGDVSIVLRDPLLDGYLAVIMPTRGAFPPKENQ